MNDLLSKVLCTQAVQTSIAALGPLHVTGDLQHGPMGNVIQSSLYTVQQYRQFTDPADGIRYQYTTTVSVSVHREPLCES